MAKIILSGAHGTGKTTVLNMFKQAGYPVVTEVVRKLAKEKGIEINEKGNNETQMMIFNTYKDILVNTSDYVSDRGLTDVLGYSMAGLPLGTVSATVLQEQTRLFEKFVEDNTDIYYVYFPIEFPVVADGVRSTNEGYREVVDANIKWLLDECHINYLTVHGTPEERYQQICEFVKDPQLKYNRS